MNRDGRQHTEHIMRAAVNSQQNIKVHLLFKAKT